jgi:hypothetical protein
MMALQARKCAVGHEEIEFHSSRCPLCKALYDLGIANQIIAKDREDVREALGRLEKLRLRFSEIRG